MGIRTRLHTSLHIRTHTRTRRRDASGQATLEVVGAILIGGMFLAAILYLFAAGYAAVSAESAARQAAREASKGTSHGAAAGQAEADSPGFLRPQVTVSGGNVSSPGEEPAVTGSGGGGDDVSAKAEMTVPFLGFGLEPLDITITRYAVMPEAED